MKTISAALSSHIQQEVTTLATLWLLTRKDGNIYGFTDHDQDIVFGGNTYKASTGLSRTNISTSSNQFSVDQANISGILDSAVITDADLRNGKWDYAAIEVRLVNWQDLTQNEIKLRKGWLGEVSIKEFGYEVELRGLSQALSNQDVELISALCRADLGDSRCTVNLAALQQNGTVASVTDRKTFTASGLSGVANKFNYGLLTWTSGLNNGLSMEVKSWDGVSAIGLYLPMLLNVQVGDTFTITPGCDKTIDTCYSTYNNVLNFRGEPYVPGIDRFMDYPDSV